MDYHSVLKRNEPSSQRYGWNKCILLNEKSYSEKATYCMTPTIWHSGKSKTIKTVKRSVAAREKGWIGGARTFLEQWNYSVWYCKWW